MRFPIWRYTWRFCANYRPFNRIQIHSICSTSVHLDMDGNVVHDVENNEFYISLGKDKAKLQYQYLDNNVMNMYHTGVPEKHQGKGLAGHLVKAALSYVVERDLQVLPTCSYVEYYINKYHPDGIISERVLEQ